MQASSNAPLSGPGGGVQPVAPKEVPGPAIVPPRAEPPRRRTALWGVAAAAVLVAGGLGLYWNRSQDKTADGGVAVMVPTLVVASGNLHETIRVSGSIAAEN